MELFQRALLFASLAFTIALSILTCGVSGDPNENTTNTPKIVMHYCHCNCSKPTRQEKLARKRPNSESLDFEVDSDNELKRGGELNVTTNTGRPRDSNHTSNNSEGNKNADGNIYDGTDFRNHPNVHLLPIGKECGNSAGLTKKKRFRRVVGGRPAKFEDFPWMVQTQHFNVSEGTQKYVCGGSMISPRYILTAAHCVTRVPAGFAVTAVKFSRFRSRDSDLESEPCLNATVNRYFGASCSEEVEDIIVHENYSVQTHENDMALIRLANPIKSDLLTEFKPICLPFKKNMFDGDQSDQPLQVAGWGQVDAYFDPSTVEPVQLNVVNLRQVPREYCDAFFSTTVGKLEQDRICTLGDHEKADCGGDSGSPISTLWSPPELHGEKRTFQVGIVSAGEPTLCGKQGVPGVASNVVEYVPWILDKIRA